MSRSHGPAPRPVGQHPQWRRREQEQQAHPHTTADRRQPAWPNHVQTAAAAHAAASQPNYHFPQPLQPYDAPYQPGQGGYQPVEPGAPHSSFSQHQPAEPYPHDPGAVAAYGAGPPPYAYEGEYDQWGQSADPLNYDLGNYTAPPGGEFRGGAGPHPAGHGYPGPQGALPVEPGPYARDDAIDYEDEDAPRGGRRWLIAAALVASIGIGGGIAYAYKSYFAPRGLDRPPVVRASNEALKTPPDDPGGKRFANTDSKLMNRLEAEEGAAPQVDANGVRRVSTIAVGRDGALTPPQAAAAPIRPTVSVPGLTIVDGFGGRGLQPAPPPAPARAAAQAPESPGEPSGPAPAPQKAQVVAKAPPPAPRLEASEPPASPAPPVRHAAPEKQPASKAVASIGPTGPATTDTSKAAVNGYVAVLASHRSRMDALQKFADLQQKYDVLKGKIPDVLEADLSARGLGTMYRLVVGPPGSREAASTFCSQIKSAGHPDCWITGY